jgi:hypothetical protein
MAELLRVPEKSPGPLQSLYELRVAEAKTGKAIKKLPTLKRREEARV